MSGNTLTWVSVEKRAYKLRRPVWTQLARHQNPTFSFTQLYFIKVEKTSGVVVLETLISIQESKQIRNGHLVQLGGKFVFFVKYQTSKSMKTSLDNATNPAKNFDFVLFNEISTKLEKKTNCQNFPEF